VLALTTEAWYAWHLHPQHHGYIPRTSILKASRCNYHVGATSLSPCLYISTRVSAETRPTCVTSVPDSHRCPLAFFPLLCLTAQQRKNDDLLSAFVMSDAVLESFRHDRHFPPLVGSVRPPRTSVACLCFVPQNNVASMTSTCTLPHSLHPNSPLHTAE